MSDSIIDGGLSLPAAPSITSTRVATYILIVVVAVMAGGYYRLRTDSLFGCQATGYSPDYYLSYCQTVGYGDFEHGAFWFNLEPAATRSAVAANLLFIGNSRMEYGFSSHSAQSWLEQHVPSYFLLGFAYHPRVVFQRAMLQKLKPHARAYVINLDTFFQENASVPARTVMEDPQARSHYQTKLRWQTLHRALCSRLTFICGNSYTIFKNVHNGTWRASGLISANEVTSVEEKADPAEVAAEIATGERFLEQLGVDRSCVIFTLVPTVDAPRHGSVEIAKALRVDFISPELDDLLTFDGSHLDARSADRWAGAFFEAAGEKIRNCATQPATGS